MGPKGCMVVEGTADDGIASVDFVATDVARWAELSLDATDITSFDDLQAAVQQAVRAAAADADDRVLALRLTIAGRTSLHTKLMANPESLRAEACAWLNEASAGAAWLEKLRLRVSAPLDLAALAARDDPFGWLVRKLDDLAANPAELARLAGLALSDLEGKIPMELRERDLLLAPSSAELQADALAAARERLLAAISLGGES
jgi:hypothetical protein